MAKKLLDQLREVLRLKHYSYRTEQAYVDWVRRFILFHDKRHPAEMGAPEIQAFLAHLAVEGTSPPPPRIRPSAPFFSSTAKSSTKRLTPSSSPRPNGPSASPPSSPGTRSAASWTTWTASTN
jgi:hypothetical protein